MSSLRTGTIWRRVTLADVARARAITAGGTPSPTSPAPHSTSRTAQRVRARRARPNLKPSPKTRALDRAFSRTIG